MIIISLTTKVLLSVAVVAAPTTVGVYYCLPKSVYEKSYFSEIFSVFQKQYIYFLVSKTHINKGGFYNQTSEDTSSGAKSTSTDSEQVKEYKKNFEAWKKDSEDLNKSKKDLFDTGTNKKNYKCAIPMIESKENKNISFKFFDTSCSIFKIGSSVKATSEISNDFDKSVEVKKKSEIDYNQMYLLRVNANISEKFIFSKNLVAEVVEYDADESSESNRILSLGLDNQYISSGKYWFGKVNKVLVTSKSKNSTNTLNAAHKKSCQDNYGFNTDCLAFSFEDGDSEHDKYKKLKIAESTNIKDATKYVVKFLSTKFSSPNSARLVKDYTYLQEDTSSKKTESKNLIEFAYTNSVLGFIDMDDSNKNQLFILDNDKPRDSTNP